MTIATMLDSVKGVRKDWKEDWREDAREDWRLDFDAVAGAPVNTVLPAITGTAWVGQTLSVSNGTWTGGGITYTYVWKRGGTPIVGATSATYVLQVADLGAVITCTVTGTNVDGAASATSAGTAAVIATPANTVAPVITGNPWVGETLSVATPGTWTGGGTIVYSYQWKVDGSPVGGETSSSYIVLAGDLGFNVTCDVTATNAAGATTVTTAAVGPVLAAPVNTVAPVLSGTAQDGQTLSVTNGTWTGGSISYEYRWFKDDVEIGGATANTYLIVTGDVGSVIHAEVTATNAAGVGSMVSNDSATVIAL